MIKETLIYKALLRWEEKKTHGKISKRKHINILLVIKQVSIIVIYLRNISKRDIVSTPSSYKFYAPLLYMRQ